MNDIYRYATKLTRGILAGEKNPSRNMHNRKPFRTAAQKARAREDAFRCKDGYWRSAAPVSWHPEPRSGGSAA